MSVYVNGTLGSATGTTPRACHVQNAPSDTETLGLTYRARQLERRLRSPSASARCSTTTAPRTKRSSIAPFTITNLYVNYTLKNGSHFARTKVQFSVQNLFDNQSIVGVSPASTATSVASPNDILTIMPARAVSLTLTVDFGRSQP